MLYNAKNLIDQKIQAMDGNLGNLDDFYFDDRTWVVRYLVVDTGNWFEGRQVLLSPVVVQNPDMLSRNLMVNLTRDQIRNSPDIDTRRPVSRQNEAEFVWPSYGIGVLESPLMIDPGPQNKNTADDPHLRSSEEITGYNISAIDGEIGHIDDMIVDDDTWSIRYWIVKTKNWLPGKKVLIPPQWIQLISWDDKKVYVDSTVDSVKNSPEYDPTRPYEPNYELELNSYFERLR